MKVRTKNTALCIWSDQLATHHPLIDSQHRELLVRINAFVSYCNQPHEFSFEEELEALNLVLYLLDYVIDHFSAEEKLMLECDYPAFLAHRHAHSEYIANLYHFREKFRVIGLDKEMEDYLNDKVVDWLVHHIMEEDVKIATHIENQPPIEYPEDLT
ncbi:bacteriohemerythrin [Chrysiogenes arsenatis]|uniref:bacteriohemerythrin n=1 Tax=Chrysiogenes arsenatis TaxID=309797 RepID=UPI0004045386|nr:hemerythrin family protein [Chrysiogenes arsenatis]